MTGGPFKPQRVAAVTFRVHITPVVDQGSGFAASRFLALNETSATLMHQKAARHNMRCFYFTGGYLAFRFLLTSSVDGGGLT